MVAGMTSSYYQLYFFQKSHLQHLTLQTILIGTSHVKCDIFHNNSDDYDNSKMWQMTCENVIYTDATELQEE